MSSLAGIESREGHVEASARAGREALARSLEVMGPESLTTMGTHYNLLSDLTDVGFFAEVRDGLPKPLSSSTPVRGRSHPLVTFQRALLVEATASLGEWETGLRLLQDLRGELESMGAEKCAALFVLGLAADPLSRELVRAGEAGRVRDLTEGLPRLASEASRALGRCQPTPQASRK